MKLTEITTDKYCDCKIIYATKHIEYDMIIKYVFVIKHETFILFYMKQDLPVDSGNFNNDMELPVKNNY